MASATKARPLIHISRQLPLTRLPPVCLDNQTRCRRYSSADAAANTSKSNAAAPPLSSLFIPYSQSTIRSDFSVCSSGLGDPKRCTSAEKPSPIGAVSPVLPLRDDDTGEERMIAFTASEVRKAIKGALKWEKAIQSRIPTSYSRYLSHPACVCRVLSDTSFRNDPEIARRYLLWLPLLDSFEQDAAALFQAILDARAWKAALFAIRSPKYPVDPSALEPFLLSLCQNRAFEVALEAVTLMKEVSGICPSLSTWNTALVGALRTGKTKLVWQFYEKMTEAGSSPDVTTVECLIEAFCYEKRLSEASGLLRHVSRVGLVPGIKSVNKLVSGFSRKGDFSMVSEVLHLMILIGRPPNMFTYQEIIYGLCKNKMGFQAFRIFNDLKQRGYSPGVVTYNAMIDGLCKMGRMQDAQKLFDEMGSKGLEPNEFTFACLMDGYCKSGNLDEARRLNNEMLIKGFKEDTVIYTTMITGLRHDGKMGDALNMFEEMKKKNVSLNVSTYNTLIQGLCREGKVAEATNLLKEMLESDIQPSHASYTCLIQSLCEVGNVFEATELFDDMESRGVKPLPFFRDYIINGFCKVGSVDQGLAWLLEMLQSNLKPNELTFNTLISSLSLANRIDDAFLVLDLMFRFGYTLSHSFCSSLVNQLCNKTCTLDVEHVRKIMASDIG